MAFRHAVLPVKVEHGAAAGLLTGSSGIIVHLIP